MDLHDASDAASDGWSLNNIERYLSLRRFLPKSGGLFGSGWAQFMANQENTGVRAGPLSLVPKTPQQPVSIPPWATPPILPRAPASPSAFGDGQTVLPTPLMRRSGGSAALAGGALPNGATTIARQLRAPTATRVMQAASAEPRPSTDPSRTDVFQRGSDGRLHPTAAWHTTGPFDIVAWSHNIDWNGVGQDLENIGTWAAALLSGGESLAAPAALEALGLGGILRSKVKGAIHAHHPHPRVLGGRAEQETYDLIADFHRKFHSELQAALKGPGVPRVGGRGGSREDWARFFDEQPDMRDKAVEILRRVSRDFDIEHGTSMSPALEKELRIAKPTSKPRPPRK